MKQLLTLSIFVVFSGLLFAQQTEVLTIIRNIDKTEKVEASESVMFQEVITAGGDKRTLESKGYSKNKNEKQLIIYTAPRRVKGDKILMLNEGDDIWFYTPKTNRVRHLASHAKRQKVQGSDFSYEDMAGGKIEEDYTYTLIGKEKIDDRDCFKLELIPTESGPHYSKLILWADMERFLTLRIDYYEDGELLKKLTCSDVQKIEGHWYAMQFRMQNLLEGGETRMVTKEIHFDVKLDDALFTTSNLKRH